MRSRSCVHAAAQFVCQHWFGAKGGCLLQQLKSIDGFLGPLFPQKALNSACQAGALESTLEYFLSRTTPIWKEALRAAAKGGHLHVLRWMVNRQDGRGPWKNDFDNLIDVAASHGHLCVVKWLFERGTDVSTMPRLGKGTRGYYAKAWSYQHNLASGLVLAAANGHLAVVEWLCNVPLDIYLYNPMRQAVDGGHLEVAQWLYENKPGACTTCDGYVAAKEGNLQVLQWLHSKRLLRCMPSAIDGAAENGHLTVLQWLYKIFAVESRPAKLYLPILNGHLEVAKWLDANVPVDTHESMKISSAIAAGNGHLETLKWLHKRYTHVFSVDHMEEAARNGHLDVMKWLHEHRSVGCSQAATYNAVRNGHLEALTWIHTHYPNAFGPATMDIAARKGHFKVVRWLHENLQERCTDWAVEAAASEGYLDILLYLLEHQREGFPANRWYGTRAIEVMCHFAPSVLRNGQVTSDQLKRLQNIFTQRPAFLQHLFRCLAAMSCARGNIAVLDWVNQFGIKLNSKEPIREAVRRGDVKMLQWGFDNGFQITDLDLLEVAVQGGWLEVVRWLSNHGYAVYSLELVKIAGKEMNVPVMRWLVEHGPPLDLPTATTLVLENDHVEIAWWVTENDRRHLVLEALRRNDVAVAGWILAHTQFQDERARRSIRDVIHGCPKLTQQWLEENLSEVEICRWCFSASIKRQNGEAEETCLPGSKRRRCDERFGG